MRARYTAAERLDRVRNLLRSRKQTLAELIESTESSESTVRRLLAALERAGEPLSEETADDGRKLWSLPAPSREHTVRMTTAQLVALLVARNGAREILKGTGFDDDLEAVCRKLTDTLKGKDAELVKDLDRKFHDRGEMTWDLEPHAEALDDISSALLRCERLQLRRMASDGKERTHLFDPYTLVTHKKGLFLVGYSHDRGQRITMGIDIIREATRQRGDVFAYPDDYSPKAMFEHTIGMFTGPPTHVVLRFDKEHVRYATRVKMHASQKVIKTHDDGAIDVSLDVASNVELEHLILSYGDRAEVVSPPVLRARIATVLRNAAKRYEDS